MTPNNNTPSELRQSLNALAPYFKRAAWFSVVASLLVMAPSGYMLEVYDRVVNSRNHTTLAMLTLLVLGVYVLMEVLEWARSEVMHEAAMEFDKRMSGRVFSAIFESNLKRLPGGMIQPMHDFRTVRDFLQTPAITAAMEAPVSLVFLALIFAISPILGWASVVTAILQTFVGWLNERSTQPPLAAANRGSVATQQYADSSLRNAEVIESMGMLRDVHRRWMDKQSAFLGQQTIASERSALYQSITKFLQNTASSMLLGLSAWLLLRNLLNGGAAFMIVGSMLGARVLAPLVQLVAQWQSVINFREAYTRLDYVLSSAPAQAQGMALPAPKGVLQVEQLMAGPPGSNMPILRGITFTLMPGEVLAVVGPSASGKSTLARLLMGVWPALAGKVRLDGADVYTWSKKELGPHVGYLPQGVELFDGTLAENIARFGEVDMAKVEAAARAVGLHELIMSLPQGYDSPVGREGAMLSGGQRQRVGLARAIYGDPVFVVLDEPNSSLDEQGDAALVNAIALMKARGTTFVIMTHRNSVLAVSDKMIMMRDGQVAMGGPRDDVLKAIAESVQKERAAQQAGTAVATTTA